MIDDHDGTHRFVRQRKHFLGWRISSHGRLQTATLMLVSVAISIARPCAAADAPKNYALNYRGKVRLNTDTTIDQNGAQFTITGVSGVAYGFDNHYVAVMDNSNHLVFFKTTFKDDGTIDEAKVTGGHTIPTSRDYEGIAYTGEERNSVFLSNEATPPPPALYEYSLDKDAKLLQTVAMPTVFKTQVDNRGLESLTRRADGKEIWTANEEALTADGTPSTTSAGSVVPPGAIDREGQLRHTCRRIRLCRRTNSSWRGAAVLQRTKRHVVLPDGTLLTLERSAIEGIPNFPNADLSGRFLRRYRYQPRRLADGLKGQTYTPVKKKELFASRPHRRKLKDYASGPETPQR